MRSTDPKDAATRTGSDRERDRHDLADATSPTEQVAWAPERLGAPHCKHTERVRARGTCVDRYVIIEHLESGGMGAVYRAVDPDLNRQVALKLVSARADLNEQDAALMRERLLREAQGLARLSHPNVVPVFDVGTVDGEVFLAMEFVEGQTLREWLRTPRSRRAIIDTIANAGDGLAAAHRAGLIHRDFKPDNVLVGADGRIRVVDFGLVRPADGEDQDASLRGESISHISALGSREDASVDRDRDNSSAASVLNHSVTGNRLAAPLTTVGAVVGTPAYMAPEQHLGEPVDAATDQFSFCVTLYEALYGELPFRGRSRTQLRDNICSGHIEAPPPSARVPARIRRILVRGLSSAQADRYPSMSDLLAALRAQPGRRWAAIAAVAAAVALAIVSAYALTHAGEQQVAVCRGADRRLVGVWDAKRSTKMRAAFAASGRVHAEDTAQRVATIFTGFARDWKAARTEACEATHVHGEQSAHVLDLRMRCLDDTLARVDALVTLFSNAPQPTTVDRAVQAASAVATLRGCSRNDALAVAVPLPDDKAVLARVDSLTTALARAEALEHAGAYTAAMDLVAHAVPQAQNIDYAPLLARSLFQLGSVHAKLGSYQEALDSLYKSLQVAGRAKDHRLIVYIWSELISVLGLKLQRYPEALALEAPAMLSVQLADDDHELRATVVGVLGAVYVYEGSYGTAYDYLTRSLAATQRVEGVGELAVAESMSRIATVFSKQGKLDQAQQYFERCLEVHEHVLGKRHPDVAADRYNLGYVYWKRGQYENAERVLRQALELERALLGDGHPDLAPTHGLLGRVLTANRKFADARAEFARTLAIANEAMGPGHLYTATANADIGLTFLREGDLDRAQAYFELALEITRAAVGPDHLKAQAVHERLGDVYRKRGNCRLATEHYRRALAIVEQSEHTSQREVALLGIGACALARARPAAAISSLEQARTLFAAAADGDERAAETAFLLAQALWDSHRDRDRARELGGEALSSYRQHHNADAAREVEAWLAAKR